VLPSPCPSAPPPPPPTAVKEKADEFPPFTPLARGSEDVSVFPPPPPEPITIVLFPELITAVPVIKPPAPPPPAQCLPPPPPPAIIKYSTGPPPSTLNVELPTVVKVWIRYPPEVVMVPPVEATPTFLIPPKGVSIFLSVSMYGIKTPMQT